MARAIARYVLEQLDALSRETELKNVHMSEYWAGGFWCMTYINK